MKVTFSVVDKARIAVRAIDEEINRCHLDIVEWKDVGSEEPSRSDCHIEYVVQKQESLKEMKDMIINIANIYHELKDKNHVELVTVSEDGCGGVKVLDGKNIIDMLLSYKT